MNKRSKINMNMNNKNHTTSKKTIFLKSMLAITLTAFLAFVIIVSVHTHANIKSMNNCINSTLKSISNEYTITPIKSDKYKTIKFYGLMKFNVSQYNIEGLGNLSIMRMNIGIKQMATIVITPINKNLPILSADYIYTLSKRTSYLKYYDVVETKDKQYNQLLNTLKDVKKHYKTLDNITPSKAWYDDLLTVTSYKCANAKDDSKLEFMLTEHVNTYIKQSKAFPKLSKDKKDKKKAITQNYINELIEKGGISTNIFKSQLGINTTKDFFNKVFLGTE